MKEIPLTQGKFALVNDEDYKELIQYKWYLARDEARRSFRVAPWKQNSISLQAHIMKPKRGQIVLHSSS